MFNFKSTFILTLLLVSYFVPNFALAGFLYSMPSGQAVNLNYISKNVFNCLRHNNYHTMKWGNQNSVFTSFTPAQSGTSGQIPFAANELPRPGLYTFVLQCEDDDQVDVNGWPLVYWSTAPLQITPPLVTGLSSNCNNPAPGKLRLSWNANNPAGATGYRLIISRPGSGCPSGFGIYSATECSTEIVGVAGSSYTFDYEPNFNYSWRVLSKFNALVGSPTSGTAASCSMPSVDLKFI